ncbi:MAG: hypothetical protein JKY94_02195, partial [Rhodobacteraceae bacterium]|nr:hypothetical protein [Paracoccaceae bacterium]
DLDRRYPFEATADSVCPVPDDAKVFVWFFGKEQSSGEVMARNWDWDTACFTQITHFLVTEYPPEKHTAWIDILNSGGENYVQLADEKPTGRRLVNCLASVKIEWTEGEGL